MAGCQAFEKQLSAYLDGELEPVLKQELEEHLKGCPRCRQALQELSLLSSIVKAEQPAVPDKEWQRRWKLIREAVPEILPRVAGWRAIAACFANRREQWVPLAAAAALFLVLVFGFSVLEQQRGARLPAPASYDVAAQAALVASTATNPPELLDSFSPGYIPFFLTSGDRNVAIVWLLEKEEVSPESSAL